MIVLGGKSDRLPSWHASAEACFLLACATTKAGEFFTMPSGQQMVRGTANRGMAAGTGATMELQASTAVQLMAQLLACAARATLRVVLGECAKHCRTLD